MPLPVGGGDESGAFEDHQECPPIETAPQHGTGVARAVRLPRDHPDLVGAAGQPAGPAANELHGAGVGEPLAELTGDPRERVQLTAGLVRVSEPNADAIGVLLPEGLGRLKPERGCEGSVTDRRPRWTRPGRRSRASGTGGQHQHARDEQGGVAGGRQGSDSATGPISGPDPSGFSSCPRPAYRPPRLRTRSARIVGLYPKPAASSTKSRAPSSVRNTLTNAKSPGSPASCLKPWNCPTGTT